MISFGRNVLSELGQKVEWREDLEIPFRTCFEVVGLRIGKDLASIFLGLVDDPLTNRDRLKGQRTMYCTRRSIPDRSPADKSTDWSTLKPSTIAARRCPSQDRIFSATSGSILPSLRYRENTASCQATSRRSMSNSGKLRNSPSGV